MSHTTFSCGLTSPTHQLTHLATHPPQRSKMAILLSVLFLLTTVVLSLLAVLFLWWIVLTVRTRKVIHHSSDSPHVFTHPALGESAVSLSESLRKGKYTSSELVSVFRKQIDRTTQVTNAVANRRYLQAKKEGPTLSLIVCLSHPY